MSLSEAFAGMSRTPKVLTLDIETSPALAYVWGLFDQNVSVSQIVAPSRMLCFAGKWLGDKQTTFVSEFHDGKKAMIQNAWDMLNDADIVVGYNHVRFDIPHMNREFMLAGLVPPSPVQHVDLLQVMRRNFKMMSNKLGYVTNAVGLDTKLDTGGQALWNDVMANDSKAWDKFRKYNIQDVVITEQLFELLAPWIKGVHAGLFTGDPSCCYSCGSINLVAHGVTRAKNAAWPLTQCADCGAWNKVLKNGATRAA
ncbi:MAG TPA: ribonuclease H-like domain-containing protein [Pseudomonadales bacterium]|nr:ribonuclease H-like domain-containing protein [Pseudomonadales bacterium]